MIHVGFVVDNNYCKYLAVTLATILKSSSEKMIILFISLMTEA